MKCQHFGVCGGCELDSDYEKQLESKLKQTQQEFSSIFYSTGFSPAQLSVYASVEWGFRARAEFRFYTDKDRLYFAMSNREKSSHPYHTMPDFASFNSKSYALSH